MRIEQLEETLGFRVSDEGLERLRFIDDDFQPLEKPEVRALQPVMPMADARKLWNVLRTALQEEERSFQRHKEAQEAAKGYKAQLDAANAKYERLQAQIEEVRRTQPLTGVDAYKANNFFADGID